MLDKPAITDDLIISHLTAQYGLTVSELEFLPLGYDSYASVYRVDTPDHPYFLKLKQGEFDPRCATVPDALQFAGISEVVAPISTLSGALSAALDTYTVLLYPFIDGENGMRVSMSADQWRVFGKILHRIHSTPLEEIVAQHVPREAFDASPRHQDMIARLHTLMADHSFTHPIENEAAAFWQTKIAEINLIVERTIILGSKMRDRNPAFVLCHADIHTANLLIDQQGNLHIVDWDQPIFAPIERDLMFIAGLDLQRMSINQTAATPFFEGYGTPPIDPVALAYYRYERVMEDIAEFAHSIFEQTDLSDETRADALHWLRVQFAPGDMLDSAHQLYSEIL